MRIQNSTFLPANRIILMTLVWSVLVTSSCSFPLFENQLERAAKTNFTEWASSKGKPYQDVSLQELSNDGFFAEVEIKAQFRSSAQAEWKERKAKVPCRKVGEEWQCDSDFCFVDESSGWTSEQVLISTGPFQMGCDIGNPAEYGCYSESELPLHTVYLDTYCIDKYEVTNARYEACVDSGFCSPPTSESTYTQDHYYGNPNFADHPVVNVSWLQASAFCVWEGKRLPTEAEWEKAARGSSDVRAYPWGDEEPDCTKLNYLHYNGSDFEHCVGDTSQVGSYPNGASPYGVMDMAGNVYELVNDWYQSDYYRASPPTNPPGPEKGWFSARSLRGGTWESSLPVIRVAYRDGCGQEDACGYTGFRCAQTP